MPLMDSNQFSKIEGGKVKRSSLVPSNPNLIRYVLHFLLSRNGTHTVSGLMWYAKEFGLHP